ncbi:uncharacterized protein clmna isoform X2 [Brachyhypopomus gauderio]|uniref:uncharacterized protein clmna isoform X2 n=1 Tax=Brachyhypopomus gauderio TaxID=698409 RepID=UPI0040437283
MAGQEWEDWFEREEFIGQISDIRVQNLQVEREVVQKRTFTRWMNLHLEKCNPPLEVRDLFRDIRDGRILMALLEELSGCRLLHGFKPSSHRIFRLNNIAKVLTFLEERNVKLVSIDAADIADGNSSIVLGLIWNIILFFQIKELTGNIRKQFPSLSSLSSIPTSLDSDTSHSSTPSDEKKPSAAARDHGKAIKTLLQWVQRRTRKYGVAVQDFGKSWTSGLAFLAVIKSIDSSLVDMRRALLRSSRENIEEAFRTAHYSLGIPRLLEPEDVTLNSPDEQSIMTYVSQFLEHFPGIEEDDPSDFRSKVNARMNEPPYRNGVQRKEKFCVVKRDWVQPPPKIFISSVAEGQEQVRSPAQPRITEDRPWDSEESSVGSSPSTTDSRPLCHPLALNKDPVSSTSSSPQPSLIDSVMDSPDSWSEMPSELPQSCSDISLSESAASSEQRYSAYSGELTSDQESPLLLERVSQDQVDTELFVDEGNFSLSSVDSFQAKSTLMSEEEDAYRYILDLKEQTSADHITVEDLTSDSNAQQTQPSPTQSPELVKPASLDTSCGDSDSGYYPGQKDISATQPEEVSKSLITTHTDEPIGGIENTVRSPSECSTDGLESTKTEAAQISTESDQMAFFEDDAECPVLKYERISISESEEDVDLSEEMPHGEEAEGAEVLNVFSCDVKKEDGDTGEHEDAHVREYQEMAWPLQVDIDQKELVLESEDHSTGPNPEADQVSTSLELPQTSTNSGQSEARDSGADLHVDEVQQEGFDKDLVIYEDPTVKDLPRDNPQTDGCLGELNSTEVTGDDGDGTFKLESSPLNQVSEIWEVGEDITYDEEPSLGDVSAPLGEELEEELKGTVHSLETSVTESIQDYMKVNNLQSELEGQFCALETVMEEDVSCSPNHSSGPEALEQLKFTEIKDDMPISAIPCGDAPITDVIRASGDPDHDAKFHEQDGHSFTPPTPASPASRPDLGDSWEHSLPHQPCDGQSGSQTTWEGAERIMGNGERTERYPAELRLSLSVMPLQPAPSQSALTDSETPTQEKVSEGPVESPEQSPFEPWARHPGDWGVLESDLPAVLISGDEEPTDARESTEALREQVASDSTEDESTLLTALCSQESLQPKELERENRDDVDAITPGNVVESCVLCNRKMIIPATIPEDTRQTALSDTYLLLAAWLLVYCILVLPQMDLWTIPSLLLNLE